MTNTVTKWTFYLTILAGMSGLILLAPALPQLWRFYSVILVLHIFSSFVFLIFLVFVTFTHVQKGVKSFNKNSKRHFSGVIYFLVSIIVLISGVFMGIRSGFYNNWLLPLHLIAGVFCFFLSWKHSVIRKNKKVNKGKNSYSITPERNAS